MYILVISDSHGRVSEIEKAIEQNPDAKHIFFLGDCVRDVEDLVCIYTDRIFHIAAGNCDGFSEYPTVELTHLYGKKILFCHGHTFSVKYGKERLYNAAESSGADLVLFGHTHIPLTEYADGRYFVNPGSIGRGGFEGTSYAKIDLTEQGIMPNVIRLG